MDEEVARIYGNKVRVRACGLCWKDDLLLVANHAGITPSNFWAPPGGGVEFGTSIDATLRKEFMEETGLHISPGEFRFGCEYIQTPIHSIELFYSVSIDGGELKTGSDPEIQIIKEVKFMSWRDLQHLPADQLHGVFRFVKSASDLKHLSGFFRI